MPPDNALDEKFDLNNFQGRWYITAGLNPLFDTFPCQEHYFGVPKTGVASILHSMQTAWDLDLKFCRCVCP